MLALVEGRSLAAFRVFLQVPFGSFAVSNRAEGVNNLSAAFLCADYPVIQGLFTPTFTLHIMTTHADRCKYSVACHNEYGWITTFEGKYCVYFVRLRSRR